MGPIRTEELFSCVGSFRLDLETASVRSQIIMSKPTGTIYARAVCF